jgi:protein-S-isoprenylcysteine O-methyltransferase Ste14
MNYVSSTSVLQYSAAVLGGLAFGVAVFAKRMTTQRSGEGLTSARSRFSIVGIAIQSSSFLVASAAPVAFSTPSQSFRSFFLAAVVLGLGITGALLFDRSAKALGANWSLVARTRQEHQLVRNGPFARMRHPIYFAMLLLLVALSIGLGHIWALVGAIPLFLVGTAIRIREEERLLRQQFGDAYDKYAREVPAFIPLLR